MDNLKEKFISRDLSWLQFNERVLEEAVDLSNPLLERVKFMAIFTSNADEFYMVRVAGLKHLIESQYNKKDEAGYYPHELYNEILVKTEELNAKLYQVFEKNIKGELEKKNIFIKEYKNLSADQVKFCKRYFDKTLFPIITPMGVDQARPFPLLPSKTIAFAIAVIRDNIPRLSIVPIPQVVPRLLKLPSEKEESNFILIDEIIRENLVAFFRGWKVVGGTLFRFIRDSEYSVEEEVSGDILKAMEDQIKKRPRARIIRLEVEASCDDKFLETLCFEINFPHEEVVRVKGNFDFSYFFNLITQVQKPELCFPSFPYGKIPYENIFDKIKEGDFITHVPFQSFYPTVDLVRTAAQDKNVLAIKMTLYRTDEESAIIKALKDAAKNKKQVTVLVEIKARFEEEKNIHWVKELEDAGCHVVYGVAGVKVHSKITLIVRKEDEKIHRYVHLSTGNYNEKTARVYTDIGYFTANEDFAHDISEVFNVVTGYSVPSRWKRIIASPNDLRTYFFEIIDQEIQFQKQNKNGLIFAKMNSLEDPKMIEKLYEASRAGVKIQLIVRGICCLRPAVQGLSENIEVKSIVGRFLEHSRIFLFNNNSDYRIFLSSADWMSRNLDRRIELLFEIYNEAIKEHLSNILKWIWKDAAKSRVLSADGAYLRPESKKEKFNVQDYLIEHYQQPSA